MTAVGNARAMLDAGFTTVRNVGSANRNDVGLKQAIDDGYAVGPRIVPAGYALGATGGHCDSTFLPPSLEKPKKEEGVGDGVEELRHQVRRQRKFGAEVIKICATGGVFSRNTEPGQQQLSEAELRAIADEAHQWGVRVAAHAHGAERDQGRDPRRDRHDRACQPGRRRGHPAGGGAQAAGVVRDGYLQHRIYPGRGRKNGMLEDNLRKDREIAQIQRDNFRAAHRAGVKMMFGTDAGVMPHGQVGKPVRDDGPIWHDADARRSRRRRATRRRRWAANGMSARSPSGATATSSRSRATRRRMFDCSRGSIR